MNWGRNSHKRVENVMEAPRNHKDLLSCNRSRKAGNPRTAQPATAHREAAPSACGTRRAGVSVVRPSSNQRREHDGWTRPTAGRRRFNCRIFLPDRELALKTINHQNYFLPTELPMRKIPRIQGNRCKSQIN